MIKTLCNLNNSIFNIKMIRFNTWLGSDINKKKLTIIKHRYIGGGRRFLRCHCFLGLNRAYQKNLKTMTFNILII